jgi:hypothetical protein
MRLGEIIPFIKIKVGSDPIITIQFNPFKKLTGKFFDYLFRRIYGKSIIGEKG